MSCQTVIIVDDEEASRIMIREYLQRHNDIKVEMECCNGIEAVAAINRLQPSIVFLDIQMPGISGIDVLQRTTYIPNVIFTTAFDKYAIKAFELNAIDFLLKPYTRSRFDQALNKIRNNVSVDHILSFLERHGRNAYPQKLLLSYGNRLKGVPVADIRYLKAEKDYTQVYTTGNCYLSSQGIGTLEEKLDPLFFVRIHRSYIVNTNYIKEVYRDVTKVFLILEDGTELVVSRNYAANIKKLVL